MINKVVLHQIIKSQLKDLPVLKRFDTVDLIYENTPHLGQTVYAIVKIYSTQYSRDMYEVIPCQITSMRLNKNGDKSFSVEGHYQKEGFDVVGHYSSYYQANFKQSSIGKTIFIGPNAQKSAEDFCSKKNNKIISKIKN